MKKYFLTVIISLVCANFSMAQEEQHEKPSPGDQSKVLVDQVARKINLNKTQKDSLNLIFQQFTDDIQKYRAQENDKVFNYLVKSREDKIKILLKEEGKYEKYLLVMEELRKKQESPQSHPPQQHPGGQHNPMGGGQGF
jgi:hypothetical protein